MIPKIEHASTQDIKVFQEEKLHELLIYLSEHSTYYKRVFSEHNIDVNSIQSLEDLTKIPTTTKDQLQQYNDEFLCVPKNIRLFDSEKLSSDLGMNPLKVEYEDATNFDKISLDNGDKLLKSDTNSLYEFSELIKFEVINNCYTKSKNKLLKSTTATNPIKTTTGNNAKK